MGKVRGDRPDCHEQGLSDLLVGESLRGELGDASLADGERIGAA